MITVAVKNKGRAFHVVVGEIGDRDGWFTAACGFQGYAAGDYQAESVEHAEKELPWPACQHCRATLHKPALAD